MSQQRVFSRGVLLTRLNEVAWTWHLKRGLPIDGLGVFRNTGPPKLLPQTLMCTSEVVQSHSGSRYSAIFGEFFRQRQITGDSLARTIFQMHVGVQAGTHVRPFACVRTCAHVSCGRVCMFMSVCAYLRECEYVFTLCILKKPINLSAELSMLYKFSCTMPMKTLYLLTAHKRIESPGS